MQSWRQLLGEIVADSHERQRITEQLKLSAPTLSRWIEGISVPRPNNLRLLLKAVPPQYQQRMQELVRQEFGDVLVLAGRAQGGEEDRPPEIPSSLYGRIFHAYSQLGDPMMMYTIISLAVQHALIQLDPDRLGMEISIFQCIPAPEGEKIRSMRETYRYNTPTWGKNTRVKTMILGGESLAGYAVSRGVVIAVRSQYDEETRYPAHWVEHEGSAAACPIQRFDKVAGCLVCSSTQPDYFTSDLCSLVTAYAELLAIAFDREQYFDRASLSLRYIPSYDVQEPILLTYRDRFLRLMREEHVPSSKAERVAWREIEEELINIARRRALRESEHAGKPPGQ